LLCDLSFKLFRGFLQPFDLFNYDFLIILSKLAFEAIIFFKLGIFLFDVAIFTDTVIARGTWSDRHSHFDLKGAVSTATATTGTAIVSECEHTEALVTQHAILLHLFVCLLGDDFWN
jgi:hypothetical protein